MGGRWGPHPPARALTRAVHIVGGPSRALKRRRRPPRAKKRSAACCSPERCTRLGRLGRGGVHAWLRLGSGLGMHPPLERSRLAATGRTGFRPRPAHHRRAAAGVLLAAPIPLEAQTPGSGTHDGGTRLRPGWGPTAPAARRRAAAEPSRPPRSPDPPLRESRTLESRPPHSPSRGGEIWRRGQLCGGRPILAVHPRTSRW